MQTAGARLDPESTPERRKGYRSRLPADPARGVALLTGAVLCYLSFALTWSALGRRDIEFARAAALASSLGAAAALMICIQAWFADRDHVDASRGWLALCLAGGLTSAGSIAALAVVWGNGVIFWRPWLLQALDLGSAGAFALGAIALSRAHEMFRRQPATMLDIATALLAGWSAVGLVGYVAIDGASKGASFALAVLTASIMSVGIVAVITALAIGERNLTGRAFGLLVAGSAWGMSPLLLTLGQWSDAPGLIALARWIVPIGALGLAAAVVKPPRGLDPPRAAAFSPALERLSSTRARTAVLASAAAIALTVWVFASSLTPDVVALSLIVAALQFAAIVLELRGERRRVIALLQSTEQLERLANIDMLTALPNRAALDQRLREEFERAYRYEQPLSIVYVDVDHFKAVNDRYGHATGDRVLQAVAAGLEQTARSIDFVGRYGGEEFIVIAPGTWSEDAQILAERLRHQVERITFDNPDTAYLRLTISIGIAGYPEHAGALDQLIERADQALYRSKAAGRNRVSIWSTETDD